MRPPGAGGVHGYWSPPAVIRTHVSYTAVTHKRGRTVSEIHSLQIKCHFFAIFMFQYFHL